MKIRCTAGKPPEDGSLQPSHILPQSGDERASRIGSRLDFTGSFVLQRNDGEVAHIQRTVQIANTDVQRGRYGMVAHVGRVVTSSAGTRNRGEIQVVVE